jgi:hypothetical protein
MVLRAMAVAIEVLRAAIVVNGKAIDGPSFFGSNPAEVRQGPRKGLRTLAGEDDLGIELIRTLDEQQQKSRSWTQPPMRTF